jgi:hypothetical protein
MATELGLDEMLTFVPEEGLYETHSTTNTPDGWWCLLLYRDTKTGAQEALLFQGDEMVYPP